MSSAATFCSSWATLEAPISAEVTRIVAQDPGERELGEGLAAAGRDLTQGPRPLDVLLGDQVLGQGLAAAHAGVLGNAVEVLVGEQALGQR